MSFPRVIRSQVYLPPSVSVPHGGPTRIGRGVYLRQGRCPTKDRVCENAPTYHWIQGAALLRLYHKSGAEKTIFRPMCARRFGAIVVGHRISPIPRGM